MRELELEPGRAPWPELEGRTPAAVPRDRPLELPARLRRCRPARTPRPHRPRGGMGSRGRRDGEEGAAASSRGREQRRCDAGGGMGRRPSEGGTER